MTVVAVVVTLSVILLLCSSSQAGGKRRDTTDNGTVTIIFGGGISFDGPVKYFAEVEKTCDYRRPFEKVRKILATADLRVASLDSPLLGKAYDESTPQLGKQTYNYGSIDAVEGLKYAGFDIVQVANKQFFDNGVAGVKSTISALKKAGIAYVGVQDRMNKEASQKPVIKTVNGLKVGFLSYFLISQGCSLNSFMERSRNASNGDENVFKLGPVAFNKLTASNEVQELAKRVDFTVVLMHWGEDYSPIPSLRVRQIARALTVFGAKLIIGTHPHVLQGHQCHGSNALAVYSMGNFLAPKYTGTTSEIFHGGRKPTKQDALKYAYDAESNYSLTQLGMMFRVTLSKAGIIAAHHLPIEIKNEPKTNCLQPTPAGTSWIEFCRGFDLYCMNWKDVCASEASMQDYLKNSPDTSACVKSDS
eukprot:gene12390-3048_t